MAERNKFTNLAQYIDAVLEENGHSRKEIVCILWDCEDVLNNNAISIDVDSFWRYAAATNWDNEDWASGPHYPLALLCGKGWWIESTEYDSRTSLRFLEEPKMKNFYLGITEDGRLFQK